MIRLAEAAAVLTHLQKGIACSGLGLEELRELVCIEAVGVVENSQAEWCFAVVENCDVVGDCGGLGSFGTRDRDVKVECLLLLEDEVHLERLAL